MSGQALLQAVLADAIHADFHLVDPAGKSIPEGFGFDIQTFRIEAVHLAAVFGGFPLSDIRHVSLSAIIGSDVDAENAPGLLRELLNLGWERRKDFVFETEPVSRSIEKAKAMSGQGPVVLADEGDNCGAGGSVDDMTVIKEVLRQAM